MQASSEKKASELPKIDFPTDKIYKMKKTNLLRHVYETQNISFLPQKIGNGHFNISAACPLTIALTLMMQWKPLLKNTTSVTMTK
jgi:hypothetical protein